MDRFDLFELKSAAQGQWKSIFSSACGLSSEILNGRHHPCPKCGGSDRFRMVDEQAGALFCNNCFSSKNGDGIAAVGWLLDCDFKNSIQKIGQYLGLKPTTRKRKVDPAAKLEFVEWNESLAALWCLKKKPIKPDALHKIGARQAIYDQKFKVIAIPVWSKTPDNVVGWNLYNITGGTLPKFVKKGEPYDQVKVKLTFGSTSGLIGFIEQDPTKVYKTEGPTDLLALISLDPGASCICNANGAKENPIRSFRWLPEVVNGADIFVIHDCDKPGQEGATMVKDRPGWASWFAGQCDQSKVRNIVLPYAIEETHGKDIRDWTAEGNGLAELKALESETGLTIASATDQEESEVWEADDDPHRLARVNLSKYKKNCDGRLVFWRDEWWKYKEGKYRKIANKELRPKVNDSIRKEFVECWHRSQEESSEEPKPVRKVTESLVTNVIAAMASKSYIPDSVEMPSWLPDRSHKRNLISMKNGILDLDAIFDLKPVDECLLPHSSDWFSPVKLGYEFDPEADCPKWQRYLETSLAGDQERISLLQEWAGYLLTTKNQMQKFIVLEGEGHNGKTVFFAGITAMIGEENISHLSLENFGGRFDLASTIGKMANICGDVGEVDQVAEGIIKQYTGGEIMQMDRKCIQPIQVKPTAKLMFAWNNAPRFRDRSKGLWRRLLLVPFDKEISKEDRIRGMDDANWWIDSGETSGILNWAIHGLNRLNNQGSFTEPRSCTNRLELLKIESNPAANFLIDNAEFEQDDYVLVEDIYKLYREWCSENGCKPLGSRQFGKEVKRQFPTSDRFQKRVFSSRKWCYSNIKLIEDKFIE